MRASCFGLLVALFLVVSCYGSAQEKALSQRAPQRTETRSATISRDQADAIIEELRAIRRLLETNGRFPTVPARPSQRPQTVRMPVTSGWHAVGRDDAPLTLVEFADYQCPYCRRFHTETFPELKKLYIDTGKLRFIVRDMPLRFHPNAVSAAEAARCAGEQGKFWEFHEALILHDDLGRDSILRYASDVGLDVERLRVCIDAYKYKTEVEKDASEAATFSLSGTPTFVLARTAQQELNGEVIVGAVPFAVFDSAMKKLLEDPVPFEQRP